MENQKIYMVYESCDTVNAIIKEEKKGKFCLYKFRIDYKGAYSEQTNDYIIPLENLELESIEKLICGNSAATKDIVSENIRNTLKCLTQDVFDDFKERCDSGVEISYDWFRKITSFEKKYFSLEELENAKEKINKKFEINIDEIFYFILKK